MAIETYRDLEVWQRGRALVKDVYLLTHRLPEEERFGLVSQMRRAAVSVPSNIAEGWGRHYPAEFIQFLRKANGSRTELETDFLLCLDLEYLSQQAIETSMQELEILGKQLLALERSLKRRVASGE